MSAPVPQRIGTAFGRRGRYWAAGYHTGVDFLCGNGTDVVAPANSKILFAGRGGWGSAYGIQVIGECKGSDGRTYRWIAAHLQRENVSAGQNVRLGTKIGDSDSTGNVTGAHLHFEVRYATKSTRDGRYGYWDHVNPAPVLNVKRAADEVKRTPEQIRMDPSSYYLGAKGAHVKWLDERLIAHGIDITPSTTFTEADKKAVAKFQRRQRWTGSAADGMPGPLTLTRLAAKPASAPAPSDDKIPPADLLPRTKWTTSKNGRVGRPLSVDSVNSIVLHYPGDGNVTYAGLSDAQLAAKFRAYRSQHKRDGWDDIGYNYAVDGRGQVWFLTGDYQGAHTANHNGESIGVLLMLGNNEAPPVAMVEAVRRLYAEKRVRFTNLTRVRGHKDYIQTGCPGSKITAAIKAGRFLPQGIAKPAPLVSKPPATPKLFVCDWRSLLINVDGGFRSDSAYNADIGAMVAMRNKARARWMFVVEQDTATNAIDLSKRLGPRWKYTREQGRDSRLSSAIHFDETKDRLLDSGRFDSSASTHDNFTWGLFKDLETGVLRMGLATLLWPFPIGPNNKPADDKIRYDATRSGLRQAREYAREAARKHDVDFVPILFGGDLNHPMNDKPDVVGNAMGQYHFKDSDLAAKKRINGQYSTHARPGGLSKGGRIDRWGIDLTGMACGEQVTLDGWAVGGGHNGVVVSTTAWNMKEAAPA